MTEPDRKSPYDSAPRTNPVWNEIAAEALRHRRDDALRGLLLGPDEMAKRMGITRRALERAVSEHRMLELELDGEAVYPAYFADPGVKRIAFTLTLRALGNLSPWGRYYFYLGRKLSLGDRTPLEVLREGSCRKVIAAARGAAER